METAVHEHTFHVHHGVAGHRTLGHRVDQALLDGGQELFGHHAALGHVDELETVAWVGFEADDGVGKLSLTTALLHVAVVAFGLGGDGLAVGYGRRAHGDGHLELVADALHQNLEV